MHYLAKACDFHTLTGFLWGGRLKKMSTVDPDSEHSETSVLPFQDRDTKGPSVFTLQTLWLSQAVVKGFSVF